MRSLLAFNATFAGRMLIGPALAMYAFWRGDLDSIRAGDRRVAGAWIRQAIGLTILGVILAVSEIGFAAYLLAAYIGMSLIMVRSFVEHRAAETSDERTAMVEAHWFWRLLFLNNNFHLLHHDHPSLSWYRLPKRWRMEREELAERNGGYVLPGYGHIARRWLFRRREPYVHPLRPETGPDTVGQ